MLKNIHRLWRYTALLLISLSLCVACNSSSNQKSENGKPLVVGNSPWPGFVAQFVAEDQGYYDEEGVTIEEKFFPVSTDVNTALMGGTIDVAWTGVPDMVAMANNKTTSLKLIAVSDYSNGADGILAKDINKPEDLLGKTIAWEALPLQALLLQSFLAGTDITFDDLNLQVMPAAEAATAFAANRVDVAITFEPWLSTAVNEGKGNVVFTSEDTNLIAGGLVGKELVINERRNELAAYFRALEKGFQFYESNPEEALEIVASKLELDAEELPPIMENVRLFRPSEHQSVVFNTGDSLNIIESIDFAADVGKKMGVVEPSVDPSKLYDASYTQSLAEKN